MDRSRITASFAWATSGAAIQILAQLVALVVLARLLDPYEFGIASTAILATQIALIFCEFGVGPAVVQMQQADSDVVGTAYRMSCVTGLLVAGALWMCAPSIARLLGVVELESVLRLYSVIFVIRGWSAVQEALSQRDLRFKYLAKIDAWSFIVGYCGAAVVAALAGLSYWSIAVGHIAQTAIKALAVGIGHRARVNVPGNLRACRHLFRYGVGQSLSRLGSLFGSQVDSYVVAGSLGVSAMGVYGRANQLVTMPPAQIGQVFDKVIFPAVARIQGDTRQTGAAYKLSLTAVLLLGIPLTIFLVGFRTHIVNAVLGSHWQGVAEPLGILALALPFRLAHKVSDPMARAMGATYARAWRQWLFALALLLMAVAMSSQGLSGVASAVVLASILDAGLMTWLCRGLTGLSVRDLCETVMPGARLGALSLLAMAPLMRMSADGSLANAAIVMAGGSALLLVGLLACVRWQRAVLGNHGKSTMMVILGRDSLGSLPVSGTWLEATESSGPRRSEQAP